MLSNQKNIQTKLTKGLLDLIILQLLDDHPMHGYEVITTIRKQFGVYFGASTIYPLLSTMEKKHLVKCEWNMSSDRPRKVFSLTNDGRSMLDVATDSLKTICLTMGSDGPRIENHHLQMQIKNAQ